MRAPRWTITVIAGALVLPVAGPALATAATDEQVSLREALAGAFSVDESDDADPCEGTQDDPGHVDRPDDLDAPDGPDDLDAPDGADTATEHEEDGPPEDGDAGQRDSEEPSGRSGDCDEDAEAPADREQNPEPDGRDDADGPDDGPTGRDTDDEQDDAGTSGVSHGEIVSRVARCAPRGPGVEEDWGLANHGAFVRAAAHGEDLTVRGETYDLSTLDGADALCDAVEQSSDANAVRGSAGERDDPPPDHAGNTGPPDHASNTGPPDHAGNGGPPDHAGGR